MKKIIIILIAIIVVVGGIVMFAKLGNGSDVVGPTGDTVESGSTLEEGLAAKVKVESVQARNATDQISVQCVYPKITSFENKEFENYINRLIANNVSEYRSEINSMVDDLTPDVKFYRYTADYTKDTWGNYLTLIINQDYQTGGIRSDTWKEIYNIDVSTERIIYLDDIFAATTDYESAIIAEVTKQAAEKNYKLMGGDGLTRLPTKQKFYIKDGKLFIYFDPSEIAAATYGALEFEMPFTLNSDGNFDVN